MMKRTAFLITLASLLLLTGVALANGTPIIDWWVIGGGGGHAEAGIYTLDASVGQAVAGVATDAGSELCTGFWCGTAVAAVEYNIYLPLVLKSYS
jgi:hypothetical protein